MELQIARSQRIHLQLFVVLSCLAIAVLMAFTKVRIEASTLGMMLFVPAIPYLFAIYAHWRKMQKVAVMCEVLGAGTLLTLPVLVSTYLAMSLEMPLADHALIAMDDALGFDWHALIGWVNSTPLAEEVLARSYTSFSYQLIAVPILLVAMNNSARACAFVAAYAVVCFISSFISIWYPALGTYTMYGVSAADVPGIRSKFGFEFLADFTAVRESADFTLSLNTASGILTFPSVHAAVAFLIAWAMWDNRYLRLPFLGLNLLMAFAAITHANHYLVDIIAGAGITGISVAIVSWWMLGEKWRGFRSPAWRRQVA